MLFDAIKEEKGLNLSIVGSEQMIDKLLLVESDYSTVNDTVILNVDVLDKLEAGFYVLKTSNDFSEVFRIVE